MRGGDIRWGATIPVLAYALLVVVLHSPPWDPTTAIVTIALAVPFVDMSPRRLGGWGFVPAGFVGSIGLVSLFDGPASLTSEIGVGMLVGGPLLVIALASRGRGSIDSGVVGTAAMLAVAAFDLAVVRALPTTGALPFPAATWSSAISTVVSGQGAALRALGAGGSIPPAPLGYSGDGIFDLLGLVAVIGFLVGLLIEDPAIAPSPEARAVIAAVLNPRPPLAAIAVTAGAAIGFVYVAAVDPVLSLLTLSAAVVLATASILIAVPLRERRRVGRRPRGAPDS